MSQSPRNSAEKATPESQNTMEAFDDRSMIESKSRATAEQQDTSQHPSEKHPGATSTGNEQGIDVTPTSAKEAAVATVDERESENDAESDDESRYISGLKLIVLTFGLCLAIFVIALDNTIIATAIPRITTEFNSLDDVGWYGSSYLLTTTALQPSFGKIITYFSVKWVYLSALLIFEAGSIVCATAVDSKMFIVGRAVAGIGAAALFSGGMTILALSVPLRKRAIYLAMLSSMFGIASVVGPILGGALTDRASWRWCFWINLPFGGIACLTVLFFFSEPTRRHTDMTVKQKLKQIDFTGALTLIAAIVCLVLALQWGGTKYPWHDSRVWGCLLGFGLLAVCFCAIQIYLKDRATMPPRILCGQRTVGACALFSAFLAMALYTHIYYLPFYFQAVKGASAEGSGIHIIPYLVSMTVASIIAGGVITALGPYNPPMWFGIVLFAVGAGLLSTLRVDSHIGTWIGYEIIAGLGMGSCVQIPFIAVQAVLNDKDMPVGNSVAIFFNTLGGAISVSVAENIFTNTLITQIARDAPGVSPQTIVDAGATHIRQSVTPEQLPGVLEAYDEAVMKAFIFPIACAGCAFLSSLLMEWKSVKGKKLSMG